MENVYDPTITCKASGTINKIIGGDMTIHNCGYYYRFRLNNGTRDYVIRGLEKNEVGYGSGCENGFYAFSGGQLPKVGDQMYIIAQYSDAWIIEQGKDSFLKYEKELPDCPITADGSPSYDEYNWADKCKVSGKVENISRSFTDTCGLNLGIKVKNGEETYIVGGREYFSGKDISLCLGAGEGRFQIDSTDGKITTQINEGNDFYAVLNQKDNTILRYGQDEYNADNSPVCSGASDKQIQEFKSGITENQLTLIMNTVEKQILHDFPDLRHKPIASTGKTETVSGSAIDKVENKAQETKIVYVKPSTNSTKTTYSPKISTILPDIIKKEINGVIQDSNGVNNTTLTGNIQEQEINTGVTTNEENVIKTEIKIEEPKKIEGNQSINYFWIIGAIIVLIIGFRLILKKTKRK